MSLVIAAAVLAAAPAQVPDAYLLARQNRIYRLSDWDTANPTLEWLVTHGGTSAAPTGLEIDRQTGDFLVLLSDLPTNPSTTSFLLRVDSVTGATLSTWEIPVPYLDGLEQRSDGQYFALAAGAELLRLDIDDRTYTSVPLVPSLPGPNFYGMTMDETGHLLVNIFGGVSTNMRFRIDPIDGSVTSSPSFGSILGMEADGNGRLLLGGLTFSLGVQIEDLATGTRTTIPGTQVTSNVYAIRFSEAVDGDGVEPICLSAPNSTGEVATLETLGTNELSVNQLELSSRKLPPQSLGYFLTGPNLGFQALGSGLLCIGTPQSRYSNFVQYSGLAGVVRFEIDAFSIPSGGPVVPGRTDLFQYWYRDNGGTSNLSNGLAVTWQ